MDFGPSKQNQTAIFQSFLVNSDESNLKVENGESIDSIPIGFSVDLNEFSSKMHEITTGLGPFQSIKPKHFNFSPLTPVIFHKLDLKVVKKHPTTPFQLNLNRMEPSFNETRWNPIETRWISGWLLNKSLSLADFNKLSTNQAEFILKSYPIPIDSSRFRPSSIEFSVVNWSALIRRRDPIINESTWQRCRPKTHRRFPV